MTEKLKMTNINMVNMGRDENVSPETSTVDHPHPDITGEYDQKLKI